MRDWGDLRMFAKACGGEGRAEGLVIHTNMNENVDYHLVQQDELIIIDSQPSLTHERSTRRQTL